MFWLRLKSRNDKMDIEKRIQNRISRLIFLLNRVFLNIRPPKKMLFFLINAKKYYIIQ